MINTITLKKMILCLFVLAAIFNTVSAQVNQQEQLARQELQKRGFDEEEVSKKLEERGFDLNNLQPTDYPALEKALNEIAAELEQEKDSVTGKKGRDIPKVTRPQIVDKAPETEITNETSEQIEDAIEKGASIKEAVSSEIIDQQNEDLPQSDIYGQSFYRNKSIKLFTKSYDVKPSPDYILGVGDVVSVDIWGISEESGTYEISSEGYIKPSRMPRINLKGVSYKKAKNLVRSRFSQFYNFREEQFELSINYARTISVNIVGEVINPGTYSISAVNTGFNALVASGGPSDIGTVRNIRIKSAGASEKVMDLYEFLLNPAVANSYYLNENDYIYVDVADRIVEVIGQVKRPMRYELKAGEELKNLFDFAGGFTDRAYLGNIQITRFENDEQKIIDLDFGKIQNSSSDFKLLPGDRVVVNAIPRPYQNFAEIAGAVELPSKYEISKSTKLSDLIAKGILKEGARLDLAFLLRTNEDKTVSTISVNLQKALSNQQGPDNMMVLPKDKLMVLSSASFADRMNVQVTGAVRNPVEAHPIDPNKEFRVSDAVQLASGLTIDAANFGYIFRKKLGNGEIEYIRVDLSSAMSSTYGADDIILRGGDQLRIVSTKSFTDDSFVRVNGAVRSPGEYKFGARMTLKDVLSLSGGLKLEASRSRIEIARLNLGEDQKAETTTLILEVDEDLNLTSGGDVELQPFDQIYVRNAPEFEFQRNISVRGEVVYPGTHTLIKENERVLDVVKRIGGFTNEAFIRGATLYRSEQNVGFVVLDLEKAQKNPKSGFNLVLQEGDVIEIPKIQGLVSIVGDTRAREVLPNNVAASGKISAPFEPGKSANFYVENYTAGVGETGKKRLITVEHPNGEIQRTKNLLFFNLYPKVRPGSLVRVGTKPKKEGREKGEKEDVDWGRVFADAITQATAILSIVLLVQNINK